MKITKEMRDNFHNMIPRTIFAEADPDRLDKTGQTFTGGVGYSFADNMLTGSASTSNIYRNPARRFYDPEITTTAIYLPRNIRQKNRWCRWFFDHDEMVGAVLELHSELPYSRAEIMVDDPAIKRHLEECLDRINFFSMLPLMDLEFMKIGEVFIHTPWDDSLGMWSHIILHNPDFVEVKATPFADTECVIEIKPDDELKKIIHTTKPEEQQLKKRLPKDVVRRVLTGKNILLDTKEVTHIARRSNPYDIRGTSILNRLFRCYVPGTKVRLFDGTTIPIEEVTKGTSVLSLHGEKRDVLDTVSYDVDTSLIEVVPEKSYDTLQSTEGHEYLIRRQYCSCGCGELLNYKSISKGYKYLRYHNLKDMNKVSSDKKTFVTSKKQYKIEKVEAQNLRVGDQLLIPINNDIIATSLNKDTARLLGYYLAEGCCTGEKTQKYPRIEFSLNIDETDTLAADILKILKDHFDITGRIAPDKENGIKVIVGRKNDYAKLHTFIRMYVIGDRAWNKELIPEVMFYDKNIQKQILYGEALGDGWYASEYCNEARICTTSKKLAEQIQWMLFRNKIYSAIKIQKERKNITILNYKSTSRETYHVRITGIFAKQWIELCWKDKIDITKDIVIYGIISSLKYAGVSATETARYLNNFGYPSSKGGKFYASTVLSVFKNKGYNVSAYQYSKDSIDVDDNYFYVPIKEINKVPYVGKVYDITVDTNHWWLGQGLYITSNTLMYEDKLRESQLSIADNFIYPLKIFKLGDPKVGWIPDATHQRALAQMLQQANFDPNFSLIYHYGLNVEYMTVADKVMRLEKEWEEINERKMIALGISKEFMQGGTTYASANVGLQIQMARYKAKRDLFEYRWMRDKLFRIMAEKNGWYKRDTKEIVGQYRVSRKGEELKERLIMPKLMWHKKLMMRDDQQFLTFMNNVYAQGKGPISSITMLMAMGLDVEGELRNKRRQKELEDMVGEYIHPPAPTPGGAMPAGPPGLGALAKIKGKFKTGKKTAEASEDIQEQETTEQTPPEQVYPDTEFTAYADRARTALEIDEVLTMEKNSDNNLTLDLIPSTDNVWYRNINSPNVPSEVVFALTAYDGKLRAIDKKYNGNFKQGIYENSSELLKSLVDIYVQGKLTAYNWTDFLPVYKQHYAQSSDLRDYSDIVLSNEFEDWITSLASMDMDKTKTYKHLRDLSNTCYCYGQIKGFQEQGIYNLKVSNARQMDGVRYLAHELTKKGRNLSSVLSQNGEIILFAPCIEGFDDPDLGNTIDSLLVRRKDSVVNDISIKGCPVEYLPFLERFLNKLGKYLKKEYDNVIFVPDVLELPEWISSRRKEIEADCKDIDEKVKQYHIANVMAQEQIQKRGKIPTFKQGKTLFVSNWIGMEDVPLTENLIRYLKVSDESLDKAIRKHFGNPNYDLTDDEINTYTLFGYIEPVYNHNEEVIGWRGTKKATEQAEPVDKVVHGKAWNDRGKCTTVHQQSPLQLYQENLKLWIDYPHYLGEHLRKAFEAL